MADTLSVSKWKSVLKEKDNADAKDTDGLTKALEQYAKAESKAKDDPDPLVGAIEDVIASAKATRSKNAKKEKLLKFLDGLTSEAGKEKVRAERMAQEKKEREREEEDTDEGGSDEKAKLTERLFKVKKLEAGDAKPFVLALGSKAHGLVIGKTKALTNEHRKRARAMRDGNGKLFTGVVYGEGGKYVFQMEAKPPGGIAKAIKKAAALHSDLPAIRVLLRGPDGYEVDDEADIEDLAALGSEGGDEEETGPQVESKSEEPGTHADDGSTDDGNDEELRSRFSAKIKELAPRIKDALTARGPDAAAIDALRNEAREFGNKKDYTKALDSLGKLEALVEKAIAPGSDEGPGAAVLKRIAVIGPKVKELLVSKAPSARDVGLKFSEAQTYARKGDFDKASELLAEVEKGVGVKTDGSETSTPKTGGEPGVARAFKVRLTQVKARFDALKASQPERAKSLAGLLMQAGSLAQAKDFEGASLRLDEVEKQLEAAGDETPPTTTGTEEKTDTVRLWVDARDKVIGQMNALQAAVIREGADSGDADFEAIAQQGLAAITQRLQVGLHVALLEFDKAAAGKKAAAPRKALAKIGEFKNMLATNPMVRLAEKNPWGVKVEIRSVINSTLDRLTADLDA